MQIGNYIEYLDTDAAGNILDTSNKLPCKYNAKAVQSNCFHSDTTKNYIAIGNRDDFSDVTTVEMTVMFDDISFTQTTYFFSNLLKPNIGFGHYWNQRNIFCLFGDENSKRYLWTTPFNIEANIPYHLRLSYAGTTFTLTINGQTCSVLQETEAVATIDNIVRIGTRDYTSSYGLRNASIWNFRCYNSNNELVHHYPLSEGMGKIVYDTVGGKHGVIINAGNLYSVVWAKFQDDYHYNLTNGYISVDGDDCNRFLNTLKVPLKDTSEVLIMKDSWNGGINNYAKYGDSTTATCSLKSDTDGSRYFNADVTPQISEQLPYIFRHTLCTEFNGTKYSSTFTSPNLPTCNNYWNTKNPVVEVTYKFKFKYRVNVYKKNDEAVSTLPNLRFLVSYGNENDLIGQFDENNIPVDGTWKEDERTITIGPDSTSYSSSLATAINALLVVASDNTLTADDTVSLNFDLKDIRLYRTSNCTYHPPILNGHNGAETSFDFSQGISDVAEVKNDLLYNYRPCLIETTDESLGANGSMRPNGWSGAMGSSAAMIANGLWSVYYDPTDNSRVGYIDNYTLTEDELAMMGLSSKGVAAQAVQLCCGISNLENNNTTGVGLYYRVNLSTLMGRYLFPNVLGWSYKVHFTGWIKKLCEYDLAYLAIGTGYQACLDADGNHLIPTGSTLLADGQFHYVDKLLSFYAPNYQNSATSTGSHLIGIYVQPTRYSSFINPDTGAVYTTTEAVHRPAVALAKVKITLEPQELYFKDGTSFKLMNFNNSNLSKYQSQRQNNQIAFNHD